MSTTNTSTSQISAEITASIVSRLPEYMDKHIADKNNPHNITCDQINAMPYNENVVIDANYTHTDNNYSNEEKSNVDLIITKIDSIVDISNFKSELDNLSQDVDNMSAVLDNHKTNIDNLSILSDTTKSDIDSIKANIITLETAISDTSNTLSQKVDKIEGKGLSTEDFTTELKTKLENLESGSGGGSNTDPNHNYIINQTFKINTRKATSYLTGEGSIYCVDRWIKGATTDVTFDNNSCVVIQNTSTTDSSGIGQFISDIDNIKGKTVTLTISTSTGNYSLTADLPEDPTSTHLNTVIATQTTDFGNIQIEFNTEHFFVNILMNPQANETDTVTMTLKYAKLEVGNTFTGIKHIEELDEKLECWKFYQRAESNNVYIPAYCQMTSSNTSFYVNCVLAVPMRKTPTFVNKNANRSFQVCRIGKNLVTTTYTSITATLMTNDLHIFALCLTKPEDNSSIMNGSSMVCDMCAIKFNNFAFDSEIYS